MKSFGQKLWMLQHPILIIGTYDKNGKPNALFLLHIIAILLLSINSSAKASEYFFRHFTTYDGLLNNEVKAILRDSYGYLWVGSVSGLNRWDGYRLKAYENAFVDNGNMPLGDIFELQEDQSGSVWANCRNGFVVYKRETDCFFDAASVFFSLSTPKRAKHEIETKKLHNIHIDSSGNVWAVFSSSHNTLSEMELQYYNYQQKKLSRLCLKAKSKVEDIKSDGKNLLLLDSSGNLSVLDISHQTWKNIETPSLGVTWNRLYVDKGGSWWLFSTTSDILLHRVKGRWETIELLSEGNKSSNYIRGLQDDGINVWIATDHQGLYLYNKQTCHQTNIRHNATIGSSIAEDNVGCIHVDNDNILWIGYSRKGLSFHNPSSLLFTNIGGKDMNNIRCTAAGSEGRIWMGTDGNGLKELSRGLSIDIPGNIVVSVLEDNNGRLWVGTYMHGLLCYDNGRLWKHYTKDNSQLADNSIYSLEQDRLGKIWIGSLWGNIQCLDPENDKWTDFRSGHMDESVAMCFHYEGGNEMLAGTLSGLCQINIVTGKKHIVHCSKHGRPFFRKDIQSILRDRRGLLWLAHGQGITVWDTRTDSLYTLNKTNGLCDNVIRGLLEDYKGNVWIATSNGCSKATVNKEETAHWSFSFCNYSTNDGLLDNNISRHSICPYGGNDILIGSSEGYSIVNVEALDNHPQAQPQVYFTGLEIAGEPIIADEGFHGRQILECPIEQLTHLNLRYSDTQIKIAFSSMDLTHTDKIRYAYKLEGLSDKWIETSEAHVSFGSLRPGNYKLHVKACSSDGKWSGKTATLSISVTPPFWLSWYAIAIYVFIVVATIVWWWRRELERQRQRIERQRIKMEQEQQLKMNEMKLRFFTNISHDFRTPLSLIITPLQSILKESHPESLTNKLRGIERNADRLLALVNQLLDFRRLDVGGEKLNREPGEFVFFIVEKAKAFEEYARQHKIYYSVNAETEEQNMLFDADKILKILSNLLSNAFKYTPDGGDVTVCIRRTDNTMFLTVADTGCGISDSDKTHVFERFYQTEQSHEKTGSGIGLNIVSEYAAMHGGKVSVADNSPKGAVFTVEIPIVAVPLTDNSRETTPQGDSLPRLLLAEDNNEFRHFLFSELSGEYEVLAAPNGRLALELLKRHDIDIVVSDVMMPEMDGVELCRAIKCDILTSHIPVLMLTALTTDSDQLKSLEQGADDYLTKPFNLDVLRLRLRKFIEWSKMAHSDFQRKADVQPHDITITSLDEKLMESAIAAVESNLCSDFTVEDLAAAVGLSRGHLYKKLMAITGKGPADFIRTIRLKRACQLLVKSGMQISEIAYTVGYSSPKIFARNFKAEFGIAPSEYVRQHTE